MELKYYLWCLTFLFTIVILDPYEDLDYDNINVYTYRFLSVVDEEEQNREYECPYESRDACYPEVPHEDPYILELYGN